MKGPGRSTAWCVVYIKMQVYIYLRRISTLWCMFIVFPVVILFLLLLLLCYYCYYMSLHGLFMFVGLFMWLLFERCFLFFFLHLFCFFFFLLFFRFLSPSVFVSATASAFPTKASPRVSLVWTVGMRESSLRRRYRLSINDKRTAEC